MIALKTLRVRLDRMMCLAGENSRYVKGLRHMGKRQMSRALWDRLMCSINGAALDLDDFGSLVEKYRGITERSLCIFNSSQSF